MTQQDPSHRSTPLDSGQAARSTTEPGSLEMRADHEPPLTEESARQDAEEHVLQTQKLEAVGRLATGIARDFNNALGVILGTVELALESLARAQSPADDLRSIQETARRSVEITSNLLQVASRQPVARRAVNLNAAIERELSKLAALAGPSIELVFHHQPKLHPVTIDPMQVHQLLSNLVENARDAMRAGGRILIETREVDLDARQTAGTGVQPGRFVALSVQDNGEGMNEATRLRVFDPYFSARPGRKGGGLGLAIVHGILKQNEGFVQVDSAPGAGATFWMYLPVS